MLHLIKYRFIQIVNDRTSMFWSLVWPLLLGTMFFVAFGRLGSNDAIGSADSDWTEIPVGVITVDDSREGDTFAAFLESADEDIIALQSYSTEKEAEKALKEKEISGIYKVQKEPELIVGKSGMNESILSSLLESYNKNYHLMTSIAAKHPEKIATAMEEIANYESYTKENSLGGSSLNPIIHYFFALIAYSCLSGAFLGIKASIDGQANTSPLGARRSITPTHKLTLILVDFFVLVTVHFINVLILCGYLRFILKIDFGSEVGKLLMILFMGSVIGISIGVAFGAVSKLSINGKMGFAVLLTLFPSFLAGLMFGNIQHIIENNLPIVNRINPAAVLSECFYCLGIYTDAAKLSRNLITLGIMSILILAIAFIAVRREQYDSI